MPHRTRHELEAENLVLLGKLEAMRDDLSDFLDEEDEDDDLDSSEEDEDEDEDLGD